MYQQVYFEDIVILNKEKALVSGGFLQIYIEKIAKLLWRV